MEPRKVMRYDTIISAQERAKNSDDRAWCVIDAAMI
jgi:hypothetical protein